MLLIKMENLKPVSHKEFNEFIKGKGFKGRNEYKLKDLKAKFGFKPMFDRRTLTICSSLPFYDRHQSIRLKFQDVKSEEC